MGNHAWLLAGTFIGMTASGMAVWSGAGWGILPLLGFGALGWFGARRCTHRYATLLPPVHDAGPERDHARWYCDRCGRTWDSGLETTTRPRVIYDGYDEQKAVQAAMRANVLEKQRRRMATQRAGMSGERLPKAAPASRPGPRPVERDHVLDQRAVGYGDDARAFVAARRARK